MHSSNKVITFIKGKTSKLKSKAQEFSVGHNKTCSFSMAASVIYLFPNPDGLVEVEVKSDSKNLGWIYSETTDFLMMEFGDELVLVEFNKIRQMVESKVKEVGKQFSQDPKLYHIRKEDSGQVFFYISNHDIKSLSND